MTIRAIDITGREAVEGGPLGETPRLEFLPISSLVIDTSYQREIEGRGWSNINRIAKSFDWAKFSPIVASTRPDGRFAVIDGQHRVHAAALRGIAEVPALVSDLDTQQQAAAFSWINGSVTAMTPNQLFRAALAAFEPWAVQCDAVVSRAGCKLMQFNKNAASKKPGEIFCVGLVRKFVEAGVANSLWTVLRGISQSKRRDNIQYYNQFGLGSLVPAAAKAGVTQPDVISDFLDRNDLDKTAMQVRRLMDLPEHRGKSFSSLFNQSVLVLLKQHTGAIEVAQ
ncbi:MULTISPECIES: DUF6551 family protein [unclassified Sulfitobacter]|uniref:DUF6551 family protein n=1 Tax=unclassified Sulfitobacter TaxID=196795 RepID=UPI0037466383